jgi:hypothetical protein
LFLEVAMPGAEDLVRQQAQFIHASVPLANQARANAGTSYTEAQNELRAKQLAELWQRLHPGEPPPPPPPPPPLPTQIGPIAWNPIVFGGGVPVGGSAQLTLYENGAVNFTGHFHNSGAINFNDSCVMAVRASDGTVYTFSHKGSVGGTFGSGSRDDDWGDNPTNSAIAAGWANLAAGWSWQGSAAAGADVGGLVDEVVKAFGTVTSVVAVV